MAVNAERWLPVVGYEGLYLVSSLGRIRSLVRCKKILLFGTSHRYLRVTLTKSGIHKQYFVHRIVAAAFLGPLPDGYQVHHRNGRRDNSAASLEYMPAKENMGKYHRERGRCKISGDPIRPERIPDVETWRPVPGFDGLYEVSSCARVRRVRGSLYARKSGAFLVQRVRNGYNTVSLSGPSPKTPKMASLVAAGFIGKRPDGWFVNHIDGDKRNDSLDNLEYVTPSYNAVHAFALGLRRTSPNFSSGSSHQNARLCESDVRAIRTSSDTQTALATRYDVSRANIAAILRGETWKHVTP